MSEILPGFCIVNKGIEYFRPFIGIMDISRYLLFLFRDFCVTSPNF